MKTIFCYAAFIVTLQTTSAFPSSLPYSLPFSTGPGPSIRSRDGHAVQLVGTNWPGQREAMIPEGLEYSSTKSIVSHIRHLRLNVVRMTFAIEMVDDVLDNGGDKTLEYTMINALGEGDGTIYLNNILRNNPQLKPTTTRLGVWNAIAEELAAQGVYLHLDNHMSRAT